MSKAIDWERYRTLPPNDSMFVNTGPLAPAMHSRTPNILARISWGAHILARILLAFRAQAASVHAIGFTPPLSHRF